MLIGYMRVSKIENAQIIDLQHEALVGAGVDPERIYKDIVLGRKDDLPNFQTCFKSLKSGNTLIVWRLYSLGYSLKHLIKTIDDLNKRNVGFKVLSGAGAEIDTTEPKGRLICSIFSVLSEFETELIKERTKAGLDAAKAQGRIGGRPPKMTVEILKIAMDAMSDPVTKVSELTTKLGISRVTLYRYVNGDGSPKEPGKRLLDRINS